MSLGAESREAARAAPDLAGHALFVRYVAFAAIAGVANLATQELAHRLDPAWPLMVSVLAGTAVGFLVKYALDKKWVFFDSYDSHGAEIRKILIYGLFGVVTTLLFWAIELGAFWLWRTATAKYLGATIGLTLGNGIKYLLDKHYVFGKTAE